MWHLNESEGMYNSESIEDVWNMIDMTMKVDGAP